MPIFARAKLTLEEQCLTLRPRIELRYNGPNPEKAYPKMIDILIKDLGIPRENIQEKEFKFDRSGSEEKFSAAMEVIKDFDKFSYMHLGITMKGSMKPSKEFGKEGEMFVEIEGMVRTEYPQDTVWERSFVNEVFRAFYHRVLYNEQRKKWVDQCRDSILQIHEQVKSLFNLLPKMRE